MPRSKWKAFLILRLYPHVNWARHNDNDNGNDYNEDARHNDGENDLL